MNSQEVERKSEKRSGQNEELAKKKEIVCPALHMHVDRLFALAESFPFYFSESKIPTFNYFFSRQTAFSNTIF